MEIQREWKILTPEIHNRKNIIQEILINRGIQDTEHFLNPSISDLLPTNNLTNISKAVKIILEGIRTNKRFGVFYDSADCDGNCAGTIMVKYLLNYTDNIQPIFMLGKKHGLASYGDLMPIVETTDILIVVDSSSEDIAQHKWLKENGVEVIVCDHHDTKERSGYATVINSQFDGYENPQLCGSGVTWKLCLAIDEATGNEYAEDYIDLCAVATIADVMSVAEEYPENRYLVYTGLKNLKNPAIKEIIGKYDFNSTSISYSIAPLFNSAARNSRNDLVVKLLLSDDSKEIKRIIGELKEIKSRQDELIKSTMNNVHFQIKTTDWENNKVVCAFIDSNEHAGVVAGATAAHYCRPAIILHNNPEQEQYKGSMRGFGIDNFKTKILETRLAWSGGHESAAGISIKKDNFDKFIKAINKSLENTEFKLRHEVDVVLKPNQISTQLIEKINEVNLVSGMGFSPIKVAIENITPMNVTVMQGKHCKFSDGQMDFIYWNNADIAKKLEPECDDCGVIVDVIGSLQTSVFRGSHNRQLIVSDIKIKQELKFLMEDDEDE